MLRQPSLASTGWTIAALSLICVLGFYSLGTAAPAGGQPPFANSVEQRAEMVTELREIKELLKEQNAILRQMSKTDASAKPAAR